MSEPKSNQDKEPSVQNPLPVWCIKRGEKVIPLVPIDEISPGPHHEEIQRWLSEAEGKSKWCLGDFTYGENLDASNLSTNDPSEILAEDLSNTPIQSPTTVNKSTELPGALHPLEQRFEQPLSDPDPKTPSTDLRLVPFKPQVSMPGASKGDLGGRMSRLSVSSPNDESGAPKERKEPMGMNMSRFAPMFRQIDNTPDQRSLPPSGIEPDQSRKRYCSYWIKTGDCEYEQVGCKYLHVMPDEDVLQEIGFHRTPLWWIQQEIAAGRISARVRRYYMDRRWAYSWRKPLQMKKPKELPTTAASNIPSGSGAGSSGPAIKTSPYKGPKPSRKEVIHRIVTKDLASNARATRSSFNHRPEPLSQPPRLTEVPNIQDAQDADLITLDYPPLVPEKAPPAAKAASSAVALSHEPNQLIPPWNAVGYRPAMPHFRFVSQTTVSKPRPASVTATSVQAASAKSAQQAQRMSKRLKYKQAKQAKQRQEAK